MPIAFVSGTESAFSEAVSSLTISHTVASGANRILIAAAVTRDSTDSDRPVTGVTFNATEVFTVAKAQILDANDITAELWRLVAPTETTANVVISFTGSVTQGAYGVTSNYTGVDQSTPIDATGGAGTTSDSPSTADIITTTTNCMLVDAIYNKANGGITKAATQTLIHSAIGGSVVDGGGSSYRLVTTATTYSMQWTYTTTAEAWVMAIIALKDVAAFRPQVMMF